MAWINMHGDMGIQGFLGHNKRRKIMFGDEVFFEQLRKELPPVFTREFASEKIGRIFSAKSMSNADALGTGPAVKVKIGKKIGYERESFLQWLRGKMKHDAPHVKKENTFHYMPDSTPFRTF